MPSLVEPVPFGLMINATTGVITWTPAVRTTNPETFRVRATDATDLGRNQGVIVTVTP